MRSSPCAPRSNARAWRSPERWYTDDEDQLLTASCRSRSRRSQDSIAADNPAKPVSNDSTASRHDSQRTDLVRESQPAHVPAGVGVPQWAQMSSRFNRSLRTSAVSMAAFACVGGRGLMLGVAAPERADG